jgi:hypothetical protein
VVACALSGILAAIITVLLTPLYWGSVIVPVSIVLAIAANIALPMLCRRLGASPIVSALPFVLWLIAVVVLGTSRPEGDVLLPGGSGAQAWVTYGMLAAGALAGGVTMARQAVSHPPSNDASDPAAGPSQQAGRPAGPRPRR